MKARQSLYLVFLLTILSGCSIDSNNNEFQKQSLLGVLSALSGSAAVSNVTSLPSNYNPLTVFRSSFSSKGIEENCSNSNCSILGLVPNALGVNSNPKNNVSIEIRNENSIPKEPANPISGGSEHF